jgi:hypothetical protein
VNKDNFKYQLQKFVNGGCLSASDKLLYLFSPKIVFNKNTSRIQQQFKNNSVAHAASDVKVSIEVKQYDGKNKHVTELIGILKNIPDEFLFGAYVHGSAATGEEIGYSDLDTLVILRDELFVDKRKLVSVTMQLNKARYCMMQMDFLQHHGWFVMTESDLKNYPETYFPSELFHHAKSLFPGKGLKLDLYSGTEPLDFKFPFKLLCENIERKLHAKKFPKNAYALKNLLSEFMLLPALYLQARDQQGVFKKISFDQARKDFPAANWRIMDEVSLIRSDWRIETTGWKKRLVSAPGFFSMNLASLLSPPIPKDLKANLGEKFYSDMLDFVKMLKQKIQ